MQCSHREQVEFLSLLHIAWNQKKLHHTEIYVPAANSLCHGLKKTKSAWIWDRRPAQDLCNQIIMPNNSKRSRSFSLADGGPWNSLDCKNMYFPWAPLHILVTHARPCQYHAICHCLHVEIRTTLCGSLPSCVHDWCKKVDAICFNFSVWCFANAGRLPYYSS